MITIRLDDASWYDRQFKERLDAIENGLWRHLETIPLLGRERQVAVMEWLFALACQSSNIRNIELGRAAVLALPRDWVVQNIEAFAESLLALGDEWEYRRLCELYYLLDRRLLQRLVDRGRASDNEAIVEAASDMGAWLSDNRAVNLGQERLLARLEP